MEEALAAMDALEDLLLLSLNCGDNSDLGLADGSFQAKPIVSDHAQRTWVFKPY